MTDVTQMQTQAAFLCSMQEVFWMVWWLKQYCAFRPLGKSTQKKLVTGKTGLIFLTLGYGVLWYGMREVLSCIPALLFFTISFSLLWECDEKESFLYTAGYLFGLEVTMWFAGQMPRYSILTGQVAWMCINLLAGRLLKFQSVQKYRKQIRNLMGTMGGAFFLILFGSNFLWDMLRGERVREYFYLACLTTVLTAAYFYAQKMRMREELVYLDWQNTLLEQDYRKAHEYYTENAKLYHEIHHHLRALEQLVARGENAEALEYIAEVQEPLFATAVPVRTGVELVDTVLYEAEEQAKGKRIDFKISASMFSGIENLQKKDLCALFANLTENALEAAKSRIQLTTRTVPGMLLLEIRNDYRDKPKITEGHLRTKKADNGKHGWGLRIVEQIVGKYEGQIEYETEAETEEFRVRVWLNLPKI